VSRLGAGISKFDPAAAPGTPLLLCFVFTGLKCDGKARVEVNFFKRHFNATYCCDSCFATQPFPLAPVDHVYSDFGPHADWRGTILTHEDYLAIETDPSPLCAVDGYRLELNLWDRLHLEFLGFDRDVAATEIKAQCEDGVWPGAKLQDQLDECAGDVIHNGVMGLAAWCKLNKLTQFRSTFTEKSIKGEQGHPPELTTQFKGAQVKVIMRWLAYVTYTVGGGTWVQKLRQTMFWAISDFDFICDHGPMVTNKTMSKPKEYPGA
jgi:hypothetical protein